MAGRLVSLDPDVIAEATVAARTEIAEDIAAEVHGEYPTVRVEVDGSRVSDTTYGSFDHLREWGSINNAPRGRMRAAASQHGRFTPE